MLVRAKRAGWNQRQGKATAYDDYDPPAWVDARLSEWVEGELAVTKHPADEIYSSREIHTVNGEVIDSDTLIQKGIIGDSVQAAGRWLANKWRFLEERYGRKRALLMAVAILATEPIPGNMLAIIGIAEAIRGIHGWATGNKGLSRAIRKVMYEAAVI